MKNDGISKIEIHIPSEIKVVACDGGDSRSGHQLVYLNIENGSVICPYCNRNFLHKV